MYKIVTGAETEEMATSPRDLPHGIEFWLGEQASGTTTTIGTFGLPGLSGSHPAPRADSVGAAAGRDDLTEALGRFHNKRAM